MNIDWSWFKFTGLSAVQSAAHAVLGVLSGNALNVWQVNYLDVAGIGLGAAVTAVLGSVVAYKLPDGKSTEAVSTAASLASATNSADGRHEQT